MTYPTEPNFIIKASEYRKIEMAKGKKSVWGSGAYEGRIFLDKYIKQKGVSKADIHYDPLASVPTGVKGGGARLKIVSDKKYDKDSILGRPLLDITKKEGDKVTIEDQYIVQAQSWAGSSRVATAYRSAYQAKSIQVFPSNKKQASIKAFAPVEDMVKALVSDNRKVKDCTWEDPVIDKDFGSIINVEKILNAVNDRLQQLENHPDFSGLVK